MEEADSQSRSRLLLSTVATVRHRAVAPLDARRRVCRVICSVKHVRSFNFRGGSIYLAIYVCYFQYSSEMVNVFFIELFRYREREREILKWGRVFKEGRGKVISPSYFKIRLEIFQNIVVKIHKVSLIFLYKFLLQHSRNKSRCQEGCFGIKVK